MSHFIEKPIDAVVFDCDGTLSQIEGIEYFAEKKQVKQQVALLTEIAMSLSGITPTLYSKRLNLAKPSVLDVQALGDAYFDARTPDIEHVVENLQALGKRVYVVSAGIKPAVVAFAAQLNIPETCVYAVDLNHSSEGEYTGYDHTSPLIHNDGKRTILEQLHQVHERIAFVGDGMNDISARDCVTRFVGYGGAFYREKIAEQSDFYITSPSMLPLLGLTLTKDEFAQVGLTIPMDTVKTPKHPFSKPKGTS